jgi:hypothetical protein
VTQVIALTTNRSVFLVADRRLTWGTGPKVGERFDDDTCKLVSVGIGCAIGYTGLAQLETQPTHEWVARVLAAADCNYGSEASRLLIERATEAFARVAASIPHSFVLVGWSRFNGSDIKAYVCEVTNCRGHGGAVLDSPGKQFGRVVVPLEPGDLFDLRVVGQPLRSQRRDVVLRRTLRKLLHHGVSDGLILKLLVDEVIYTSRHLGERSSVGQKVLATVIPRRAVEASAESGASMLMASEPTESGATFSYFEPGYSGVVQFGPTSVFNGWAFSKVEAKIDGDRQRMEVRVLHRPTVVDPTRGVGLVVRGDDRNGYMFDLALGRFFKLVDGARIELKADSGTT